MQYFPKSGSASPCGIDYLEAEEDDDVEEFACLQQKHDLSEKCFAAPAAMPSFNQLSKAAPMEPCFDDLMCQDFGSSIPQAQLEMDKALKLQSQNISMQKESIKKSKKMTSKRKSSPKAHIQKFDDELIMPKANIIQKQEQKQSLKSLPQSDLDLIIKQQVFDGSWGLNSQMIGLAGRAGKNIQGVPQDFYSHLSKDNREKAFATALAIFILNNFFESQKNEWKRIAIKGIKVLKELGVDDKEALEKISKI